VDARAQFGGWEIDVVLGKHGMGALVTFAERKSRLYLVRRGDSKRATDVRDAVITMLKPMLTMCIQSRQTTEANL